MPALSYSITISDEESAYLKSLIKTRTIQAQVVDRARILLWKSEAKTDKAIADGLGISVNTVRRCIDRYLNGGINLAIFDNDRSGRPVEITDDAKSWIISIACQKPCDLGYAAELWTDCRLCPNKRRGFLRLCLNLQGIVGEILIHLRIEHNINSS